VLRIANKRDFLAGLMFVGFGVFAMIAAKDLRMGSAVRMGAGFFPYILTGILILLGLAIIVSALRSSEVTSPRLAWRPLLIIPATVALFAVLINNAGLVLTSLAIVILSRLARAGNPWGETLVLAVGAAIVTAGLFHYGLGLNLPLWPQLG
jgi:Tripartite tricarboxylate transporter TctB family